MNQAQIDYLITLHDREGEMQELPRQFPEIDWTAEYARWLAAYEAEWARRREANAGQPQALITTDQINEALKTVFSEERMSDLFTTSPLLGRLRR